MSRFFTVVTVYCISVCIVQAVGAPPGCVFSCLFLDTLACCLDRLLPLDLPSGYLSSTCTIWVGILVLQSMNASDQAAGKEEFVYISA